MIKTYIKTQLLYYIGIAIASILGVLAAYFFFWPWFSTQYKKWRSKMTTIKPLGNNILPEQLTELSNPFKSSNLSAKPINNNFDQITKLKPTSIIKIEPMIKKSMKFKPIEINPKKLKVKKVRLF